MLRPLITSILLAFLAIAPAHAEVKIPAGKCAFIVASRETISEVNGFLADLDASLLESTQVIEANNGWYVISIGVFKEDSFETIKASRVAKGLVPADSLCSKGKKYARVLAETEYTLPVKVDVSDWVPVGPNAPSLALTGRASIKFSRALREGEQPIVLCPKKGLGCQFVDETGSALTDRVFDYSGGFDGTGIATVLFGKKYGFINRSGVWVVEPLFDWAESFAANGLASVVLDGKHGYINANRAWVVEPIFHLAFTFGVSGLASVELGDKYGYIDASGSWVVGPKFDFLGDLATNGLALAQEDNRSGFVNADGTWVIDPKFDFATAFAANGLAAARQGDRSGYINASGSWVIEPKFDWANAFGVNGLASVKLGDKFGYINAMGSWVINPKFDGADRFTDNGFAQATLSGKTGVINASGAWVVEPKYDFVKQVSAGLFRVDFGNSQYQGLLKADGTPLNFTEEEFRFAEIEGNQMRLEEELAKKDTEIKRLQDEAANAQAQAAQPQQRAAGQCDHVFVGRRNITIKDSGYFGIDFMWDVIGVGQDRASLRQSGGTLTRELPCDVIPY